MKASDEQKGEKGLMLGAQRHEFFVCNITSGTLTGSVSWRGGDDKVAIDVNGLAPGAISEKKSFSPKSGVKDYWSWSEKGREYQLNVYDNDRYAVVVLSDYGIGVLVTATSPDTWKW